MVTELRIAFCASATVILHIILYSSSKWRDRYLFFTDASQLSFVDRNGHSIERLKILNNIANLHNIQSGGQA